ncbi:hypothetical protein EH165_06570 [Nakamurella antarctica]|uniref:Uncharacterized protein n=1 Tax=Nakamurella antarctica TaxID=1902245 RepID=A0A3G8ZTS3_9ACTN|nr:hypothetical protein [Nakamurella antarctica]AZI57864.1 hypothetical protein EH165_06570 [Nakamurella antarctica]
MKAAKEAAELAGTKLIYIDAARELAQLTSQHRNVAIPAEQRPTHKQAVRNLNTADTALNHLDDATTQQQTRQANPWNIDEIKRSRDQVHKAATQATTRAAAQQLYEEQIAHTHHDRSHWNNHPDNGISR